MCRHTRTIGDVENSSNPVAAEQAQCNVGLDTAWTMQCGAEVDIFTDIKPAALVALAALFHQANQLACSPDEYPIKVIITGGGNRLEETRSLVRNWLDDLYESGLMPEPSHFDPQDKVLAGPEWTDRAYPGRDIDPPRAWNPFDPQGTRGQAADPLGSMFETFGSLSLLTTQEAPAIVALRPIVEFTALWTESLRDRNPPAFQTTTQYEDQRRAPPFWLGDMETMTSDVLQAFSRSRIVMFQGARSFEFVGEFFATYIMDTRALSNARQAVSDLEEALVTLPRQVLLVDRESLLASYKPRHQGLFTALSQPSVYDQLRKIASAHLLDYVTRWNRFPLETKANATLDMIPIRSRDAYEDEFRLLQRNASTLTRRLVFGTVSPIDMVRWREDLLRMKDRIRGYFGPLLRNHRLAGQHMPSLLAATTRALDEWASFALVSASFVLVASILLPFCLEPGSNLVKDSLVPVRYQAKNSRGDYAWPSAPMSNSTIYFTKVEDPAQLTDMAAYARERTLRRELGMLYTDAFTPDYPAHGP